ncbi:choice-of-anchor L domain-containing protein [Tenacibaculum salmonis]|uniref:choice-of-anchor L domain-containing protein n=1 Tax=Tenacibaculum sp. P3-BQ1 TaxID=3232310 RepID=UPI0034E00FCE
MKKNYFLKNVLFFVLLLIGVNSTYAQATFTDSQTAVQLAAQLQASGVLITNPVITKGDTERIGVFSNGKAGAGLELDSGIALTTSTIVNAFATNRSIGHSDKLGAAGALDDMDLVNIDSRARNDVVIFEFDFQALPNYTGVLVEYQFASEEFPDYVGSSFNDVFGFFVSDPTGVDATVPDGDINNNGAYDLGETPALNLAIVPGTSNPVSINNVNAGFRGSQGGSLTNVTDLTQSALYINNGHVLDNDADPNNPGPGNTNPGPFPIHTEFNGITKKFSTNINLTVGVVYHMKIAIADVGDDWYDSGVFVSGVGGTPIIITNDDAGTLTESGGIAVANVLVNDTVGGTTNPPLADVDLFEVSSTNAGVTLNTTTGAVEVASGTNAGIYTLVYNACKPSPTNCSNSTVTVTVLPDNDLDGIQDSVDQDDDNDGILDTVEGAVDTDDDGIIDSFDTDSDNDGCPDASEAANNIITGLTTLIGGSTGGSSLNLGTTVDLITGIPTATGSPQGTTVSVINATRLMIVTAPVNQTKVFGESGSFSVVGTADTATSYVTGAPTYGALGNANAGINYQWYIGNPDSGGTIIDGTDTNYTDFTTNTLNITSVTGLDATEYCVLITHDNNICIREINCATLDVVNILVANDDILGTALVPLASGTTDVSAGEVLTGDTLNGVQVTTANTDVTPITTGNILIDANGNVTIVANTPTGSYPVTYTICESGANPANCTTATVTVEVVGELLADDDILGTALVPLASGATDVSAGEVLTGDTLNGVQVTTANTDVTPVTTGNILIDANGNVTIVANTPTGSYPVTYTICESGANPANCTTATVTVEVVGELLADDDILGTALAPLASGTTDVSAGEVLTGDTLNGVQVTTANTDVTPVTTGNILIDADGNVTIVANTPTGSYPVTYTICESGANPANCTTATVTVEVVGELLADDDVLGTALVPLASGATDVSAGEVLTGDTLNGVQVTTANTDVTPVTTGNILIDADGNVTIVANTPTGSYPVTYTICESGANPANCTTATVTVEVVGELLADDDVLGTALVPLASGATDVSAGEVLTGDTLNGVQVTTANTDVTPVTTGNILIDANGNVTIVANTPTGSYPVTYTICESGANPANCTTATVTVEVVGELLADDDILGTALAPLASGATDVSAGEVLTGDTLNGVQVTTANTDVTPVTTGNILIDADGNVTIVANTPTGSYPVTYTICESGANPANCTTAIVTVEVVGELLADDDVLGTALVPLASGATDVSAGEVLTGDTLNGVQVTTANTDVTPITTGNILIDADGNVTIVANTPTGSYPVTYTICESGANPANCTTAIVTVEVVGELLADDDILGTALAPLASGTTDVSAGEVLTGDTLNGVQVTRANTDVTPVTTGNILIDADGNVTIVANTPTGSYPVTYTICESGANPANCTTATVTVEVVGELLADDDVLGTALAPLASGATDVSAGEVLTGDTLNGVQVTTANTDVTPVTTGNILIDADGNVTIVANTPTGSYPVTYTICESGANPANCTTATVTVEVVGELLADDDVLGTALVPLASGATDVSAGEVLTGDTLNGVQVTTANTDVTPVTTGNILIDADGNVTIVANTPTGSYPVTYTICESGANPANCTTATVTVEVVGELLADDDVLGTALVPLASGATDVSAGEVLTGDTLNGVQVTTANTDVTPVTTGNILIDADGNVTIVANTPTGSYPVTYTICESGANPANCTTATVTVEVVGELLADDDVLGTALVPLASGATDVSAGEVLTGDTLNGVQVTTANTDVTPITTGNILIDADGNVTIVANTPTGSYPVTYTICESGANPANCTTATVTVEVVGELLADDDILGTALAPLASGTTDVSAGEVLTGDTLNGVQVTRANTDVTPVTTGNILIDADGNVTIVANTPTGSYPVTYTICESGANPANCTTATVTVEVVGELLADDDVLGTALAPLASGATDVSAGEVLTGDTLNGVQVTTANTDVTPVTTGNILIDADGNVTIVANTPTGSYPVTYTICESGANPANCTTATVTVEVVGELLADDDVLGTALVPLASGATDVSAGEVLTGDTLNGVQVTTANTDVTPVTTGNILIDADGNVTIVANTPTGSYPVTYTICESGANPANCTTATVTVEVVGELLADDDVLGTALVPLASGATDVSAGEVLTGDTLNGVQVTTANTDVTPVTTGNILIDADGNVTIVANTPTGSYPVTYTICESGANPANCTTATVTVEVVGELLADDDVLGTALVPLASGATDVSAGEVLTGDTLNGVQVTTANTDVTPVTTGNILIDANGNVTIVANTPTGSYPVTYTICESGANPANCTTATVTVEVVGELLADDDILGTALVPLASGATDVSAGEVLTGDTLNGVQVTTANTDVTPVTTGNILIDADGNVTIVANTPTGSYPVTYTICESGANPANCTTATVTVEVVGELLADDDILGTALAPLASGTTDVSAGEVLTGDTLNGVQVTTANTDVTPVTTGNILIDADGNVTIVANTPTGSYPVMYTICESGANPANCTTATVTVEVVGELLADDDVLGTALVPLASGTTDVSAGEVLTGDTLNGVQVTTANTDVTPVTTGNILIDADGNVTIVANTPTGSYPVTYTICESGANPANCTTATVTVEVVGELLADDDILGTALVPLASGATDVSAGEVLTGDTLNGVQVTTANTDVTPVTTGNILIDADGNVTIVANTPTGSYPVTYTICESGANPANCTTATVTVEVVGELLADDDILGTALVPLASGTTDVSAGEVLTGDTLNGVQVTTANTDVTPVTTGNILIDADGNVTIVANTPTGSYPVTYTICESGANPANCTTATVTVEVVGELLADDDTLGTPLAPLASGATDVSAGEVLTGDTLNGVQVTTANTDVTSVTTGNILIDANGNVTIVANTPTGSYPVTYTICESGANPANCTTATVTVEVVGELLADDDILGTALVPLASGATDVSAGEVLTGDTLNGVQVTTANTDVTPVTTGNILIDADGNVTIVANTPTGSYPVTYTICESGANPANCTTATVTVEVVGELLADDDILGTALAPLASGATDVSAGEVLTGDTLNGVQVTTANTDVTPITTGNILIDADGNVTIVANTPTGSYPVTYTICESGANPANCTTATVTVEVVGELLADDDILGTALVPLASGTTDVSAGEVLTGDTLNGVQVTTANTDVTPVTTGNILIDADGNVTIVANTPTGSYPVTYTICESGANPANCTTAIVTVEVVGELLADDDVLGTALVPLASGATDVSAGEVLTGDTLNGVQVTTANTDVTPVTTGNILIDADGNVTIVANTPTGSYPVTYTICESGANPANCTTATVTVEVVGELLASSDILIPITSGGTTSSVTDNDTLNSTPIIVGSGVGEITLSADPNGTNPSGFILNPNGTITIEANIPSGTYAFEYQICENGANPENCQIAVATVIVANPIDAINDHYSNNPLAAGSVTPSVLINDLLDGNSVIIGTGVGEVTLSGNPNGTNPLGFTFNSDGTIAISTVIASGDYTLEYQICENGSTPIKCNIATVTILVGVDTDGDGILNTDDIDDDNDGILDTNEGDGTIDTDSDGIPDSLDTDSDNDSVLDIIEGNDVDGNGIPDIIPSGVDTDLDGLDDVFDTDNGGVPTNPSDTDGDGIFDYQDIDDDNDGINTIDENPGDDDITTNDSMDTNENGIPDYLDADANPCGTPYNIMTPDNDGDNDVFFISCIDKPEYAKNTVEIFNRWGNTVYKASGYNNESVAFTGISNGRSTISVDEKLPPGTYYYVIDLGDGSKPKVGWLYINR